MPALPAREALAEAIRAAYAELVEQRGDEPRGSNQLLTHWVVICAHTRLGDTPDDDADAITRMAAPGQAAWQTYGLMRAAANELGVYLASDED